MLNCFCLILCQYLLGRPVVTVATAVLSSSPQCFHQNRVYFQIAIVGVLSHDVLLVAQITALAVITSRLSLTDASADTSRYVNQALRTQQEGSMMSL